METGVAQAQEFSIEVPTASMAGVLYVFTVANLLSQTQKAKLPEWKYGGIVKDVMTLKYCSGYVRQCAITELRQHMESDNQGFVEPGQRRHMASAYVITEPNPTTGELGQRTVGKDAAGNADGLLRTAFYPSQEIDVLTGQVDGMVKMPCKSSAEKALAQDFLFPNWAAIERGEESLPEKTSQLRVHFTKRLAEAQKLMQTSPAAQFFVEACLAAIKSCDDFTAWATEHLAAQTARWREAQTKGWAWSFGSHAECCFEQLGVPRPDLLDQERGDKLDAMAEAMRMQAENQSKMLDLEILRAQNGNGATSQSLKPEVDVVPKCKAITASNEPCKRDDKGNGYCGLPAHQALAVKTEEVAIT